MKVHRVVLCIVDFDDLGAREIAGVLEHARYPNHCISPDVCTIETRDIGEWSDDHPLNRRDTCRAEFERLFGPSNVAALVDAARGAEGWRHAALCGAYEVGNPLAACDCGLTTLRTALARVP